MVPKGSQISVEVKTSSKKKKRSSRFDVATPSEVKKRKNGYVPSRGLDYSALLTFGHTTSPSSLEDEVDKKVMSRLISYKKEKTFSTSQIADLYA
ncbi:hypothetical protein LWI29_031871 [Acer saccharum]|uniref:Uncharacterized protein n=1 Tax=Acer saccharum TaxID=4024 RepID=A0AA39UXF9_ACESA|nr:hypothetical protein LWI29_031871 [Acer saccharum]